MPYCLKIPLKLTVLQVNSYSMSTSFQQDLPNCELLQAIFYNEGTSHPQNHLIKGLSTEKVHQQVELLAKTINSFYMDQ